MPVDIRPELLPGLTAPFCHAKAQQAQCKQGQCGRFRHVVDTLLVKTLGKLKQLTEAHKDGLINKHRAGDLYDLIASDTVWVKPQGQWNKVRLVKNRGKVEHWLNRKMILSYDLNSAAWKDMNSKSKFAEWPEFALPGPGRIGIQDHDNRVYYKNIKIKELN